jgi:hypothetical protein
MITYFIALFFLGIFYLTTAPVLLLPDASLPQSVLDVFSQMKEYFNYLNLIIPVQEFLNVIIFILGVEASILAFKIIKTIVRG